MRTIRRLSSGLALLATLPAAAAAQAAPAVHPFTNAWYWGVKGGTMTVRTTEESSMAPVVGAEWMITRTRAGLYVSVEQGFFDATSAVFDTSSATGMREVQISNYRRASVALLAYPGLLGSIRPYGGIGYSLGLVQRARPQGEYSSMEGATDVLYRIEDRRSRSSFVFMGGAQAEFRNAAIFVQASAAPTGGRFLLGGDDNLYTVETGVRFNVGSAIERLDH